MPFNGTTKFEIPKWNHVALFKYIADHFPQIDKVYDEKNSTSVNYQIPGYPGTFGIIPSFSRTFCGTCNRIRLSATGEMRTCLYGPPATNLRDILRSGANDTLIKAEILRVVAKKEKDGFEAEEQNAKTPKKSMSFLGG